MGNIFLFADEAGDFTFKKKNGASKYFILCTVSAKEWRVSDKLLHLRRNIALSGKKTKDYELLHAASDMQEHRDRVFDILSEQDFRIDSTIIEKSKSHPSIREDDHSFYKFAWKYHFQHVGPIHAKTCDKMLVTAAALGQKRTRGAFKQGVNDTVQSILPRNKWEVLFMDSPKDPLLWAADYCAWAIQRKWEREDSRSFELIKNKVATEFNIFRTGRTHFY